MSFLATSDSRTVSSKHSNRIISSFVNASLLLALLLVISLTPSVQAELPDIILKVCDVTAYPNQDSVEVCVMLDNFVDTIAGFSFWVQMDRPDIAVFETATFHIVDTTYWQCENWQDSVCTDSTLVLAINPWDFIHVDTNDVLRATIDSAGALTSGWEYLEARSLSGTGFDLFTAGIANMPSPPLTPGIPPQQGGVLVKLIGKTFDLPDSVLDRTVNLIVNSDFVERVNFARPNGSTIGIAYDYILDTTCFMCTQWCGDVCCNWTLVSTVPPGGCDSMVIAVDSIPILDTNQVLIIDGSITVLNTICGDINGDGEEIVNISDLTYLIDWMFRSGPQPLDPMAAACNNDGEINISDLTCWVCYLFLDCPPPTCW